MDMQYTLPEIAEGQKNRQKSQQTPNSFSIQDGATQPARSAPLDQTAKSRMAGQMGARAMQMMQDPEEQMRVQDWMMRFGMTNQGVQWNQAKMMMGQPPMM